jgi:hypothetical protein
MFTCRRCNGSGYEFYEEDGRNVRDACYHCATTGLVDSDLDFQDRLRDVANTLAYRSVSDYKLARNSSNEGYEEDFAFCAAENQMTEYDYFRTLVWDEEYSNMEKLSKMAHADQMLLVAWNEMEEELPPFKKSNVIVLRPYQQNILDSIENEDIPF